MSRRRRVADRARTPDMIRAALVGVSGYGRWHLLMAMEQALVGRLQLVAATIVNQADEAMICGRLRRQGVPIFADFDAMMASMAGQIDLVLLPTSLHSHARMTLAALRAGAHVLVEKPIAATLQDVDAIIALQAQTGKTVAVGFQELYVPAVHEIKRRLLGGTIGRLQRIVVRGQWPRAADYYQRNDWAGRLRLDGAWVLDSPVSNALSHFAMLALFWAGEKLTEAAEVTVLTAELYRAHAIESFDTVSFKAVTGAGTEILFYGSHAGTIERTPEVLLVGDAGQIRWIYEQEYTITPRHGQAERHPVPSQLDSRLSVLEGLVAHLDGKPGMIVTPALARAHTRLINALHEFFPIHTVTPPHLEVTPENGRTFRGISQLDEVLTAAADRGVLLSEVNAPWAQPAHESVLNGYRTFSGCISP